MIRFLLILVALCLTAGAVSAAPTETRSIVQLRLLDKATARVETMDAPLEQPVQFGTLLIIAHGCRVSPPEDQPEAAAFLEVSEFKPGTQGTVKFRGWMFASSPALSALEHPVYDI